VSLRPAASARLPTPRVSRGTAAAICAGIALFALELVAGSALAVDNRPFRCGSKIIYVGMTRASVFDYCGEPTKKSTELREVRSDKNRVLGVTEIERWLYDSYGATRVLVFLDDKLQSIESL
jgi:hypothetical protein